MSDADPGIGLVGAGDWGRNLLRVLDRRAQVVAVCHAGAPETAAWLGESYPAIDRTTDYGALLADERVDAVVLATPPGTHAAFARRALAADRHVFLEKPMGTDLAEATAVAEAAAATDRVCFVGYLFVHHPLVRALLAIHRTDPVRDLRATWHKTGSFGTDLRRLLVSHHVSVAEALFGPDRPADGRAVDAAARPRPAVDTRDRFGRPGRTDRLTVSLAYDRGSAVTTVDRVSPERYHAIVCRTEGGDVLAWTDDRLSLLDGGGFRTVRTRSREPLAVEVEAFLDCVATGRRPSTDAAFGLRVARVLDAID